MKSSCPICGSAVEISEGEKRIFICGECDNERLAAASADRIFSGSGPTFANAEKFSIPNWIAMNKPAP